jgi:hypothetical protein
LNKGIFTGLNLLIFFSIFLLPALILVAGYNVAGVASTIRVENPTQTITSSKVAVSTVLTVKNTGPFPVEVEIIASVKGNKGTQVRVVGPKLSIPVDLQLKTLPITIEVDLSSITDEDAKRLAISPENITIIVTAQVGLTSIVSLSADATALVSWLPILHNLTIGTPIMTGMNPTQLTLDVPISFENQSPFFSVNGGGVIKLFDSTTQVSESKLQVIVEPTSKWSDTAQFALLPPSDPSSFLLTDKTLTYTAVAEFTFNNYPLTIDMSEQIINLDWGALIKDPQITVTRTAVNSTHTRVKGTLTYHNNNQYITLDAAVTPKLVSTSGSTNRGETQQVHVEPEASSSLSLDIVVPSTQLSGGSLKLKLGIESTLGSFDVEVSPLG